MLDLFTLLETSARRGIALQLPDGSMPAGHNGPWNRPETELRNTGNWLQVFGRAYDMAGGAR